MTDFPTTFSEMIQVGIPRSHPFCSIVPQVQQLHDSLQLSSGGLSRTKVVGRQISHEVQQLQKRIAEQERVLGAWEAGKGGHS